MTIKWYIPDSYKSKTKYILPAQRGKVIDIQTKKVVTSKQVA